MGIARYVADSVAAAGPRHLGDARARSARSPRRRCRRGPRWIERSATPRSTASTSPIDDLREARQAIFDEVCREGFDAELNTFTQYYGGTGLDASLLFIPLTGFLPATDPRVVGTVEAIERELLQDGLLLRFKPEADVDGLSGEEGVFLACSFWLVDGLSDDGQERGRSQAVRESCLDRATTSGCSPRSTTRKTSGSSATSRRRSATSRW